MAGGAGHRCFLNRPVGLGVSLSDRFFEPPPIFADIENLPTECEQGRHRQKSCPNTRRAIRRDARVVQPGVVADLDRVRDALAPALETVSTRRP